MFNGFNRIKTRSKKSLPPSIVFSDPSLVTITTHNVAGINYRVFEIKGNSTANSSAITTTATLYNESNITIYYLVVGSGGGYPVTLNGYAHGGAGGGGLLQGNRIITGDTSNKTINFSVGSAKGNSGNNGLGGMESRVIFPGSFSICGGGGAGAIINITQNAPSVTTSTLSRRGGGNGSYALYSSINAIGGSGTGYLNGGWGYATTQFGYGGGGAGNGGTGGPATSTAPGEGGSATTIFSSTKGIYELFTNTSYYAVNQLCGGCSGGISTNLSSVLGTPVQSMYGKGSASSADNSTNRGIIVIAISVSDIPP
jgi:hypothetical protein